MRQDPKGSVKNTHAIHWNFQNEVLAHIVPLNTVAHKTLHQCSGCPTRKSHAAISKLGWRNLAEAGREIPCKSTYCQTTLTHCDG